MGAALLEVLPELALGLLAFATVVSFCMARGSLVMWDRTFGWMLRGIADFMNWSVTVFGRHIGFDFGHSFRAADAGVHNALEHWVRTSEEGMARTWRAMTAVAQASIRANEWLAKETALGFEWLLNVHLPRWAKVALGPLLLPFLLPKLIRALLPYVRTVIVKPIHVIERTLPGKVTVIVHRVGAAVLPGALGIPHIWREIHGLTKANLRLAKRLRKVEALFGAAALAAVIANVLGLSVRCLRRGNLGRASRAICGTDEGFLLSLLGDLTAILSVLSVVEFARELRTVEDEAIAIMGQLVREWPS